MTIFISSHTRKSNGNGFYILDLIKKLKLNSIKIISISSEGIGKKNKVFTFYNKKKAVSLSGKLFEIFLIYFLILKNLNQFKNEKVIFTSDPPMVGLLLILMKKYYNCKTIFWCQDIFPDTLVVSKIYKKNNFLIYLLIIINKFIYKNVDKIITISNTMKNTLINDYEVKKSNIQIIENWNSLKKKKIQTLKKNKINIFYNGNISMVHDINFAISILNEIQNNDLNFKIFTNSKIVEESLNKEFFSKGFLAENNYFKCILESDFQMIFSKQSALKCVFPSKIYNILFYEKPILYFNYEDNDEISKLIKKYNIGLNINKSNKKKIVKLLSDTNKIKNLLNIFKKNYKNINFKYKKFNRSFKSWKEIINS